MNQSKTFCDVCDCDPVPLQYYFYIYSLHFEIQFFR